MLHKAACIAAIAFSNAAVGINQALAHAFGASFGVSHGRASACDCRQRFGADQVHAVAQPAGLRRAQEVCNDGRPAGAYGGTPLGKKRRASSRQRNSYSTSGRSAVEV